MSEEHESFIKTPKQLIIAVTLSFVIPIILIMLLAKYVVNSPRTGAGADTMSSQATESRIAPVGGLIVADAAGAAKVHSGEEVYNAQCAVCHTQGVAGAPKFGDAGQWKDRISTGYDALLTSALKGKGAMAAQAGGKFSDTEIGKAVVYMTNNAGADMAEPTDEAAKPAAEEAAKPEKTSAADTPMPAADKKVAAVAAGAAAAVAAAKAAGDAAVKSQTTTGLKAAATTAGTPAIVNRANKTGTSVAEQLEKPQPQAKQEKSQVAEQNVAKVAAQSTASVAAVTQAVESAASETAASIADGPASPKPSSDDTLVFADAADVTQAVGEGIPNRLSLFFDSGKSDLDNKAVDQLWNLIYFTKSGGWSRIGLSGYTDGTGNAQINEKISRQRMGNVRDALVDIGVAEDRIVMIRPEQVQAAAGKSESARRVDVYHVK